MPSVRPTDRRCECLHHVRNEFAEADDRPSEAGDGLVDVGSTLGADVQPAERLSQAKVRSTGRRMVPRPEDHVADRRYGVEQRDQLGQAACGAPPVSAIASGGAVSAGDQAVLRVKRRHAPQRAPDRAVAARRRPRAHPVNRRRQVAPEAEQRRLQAVPADAGVDDVPDAFQCGAVVGTPASGRKGPGTLRARAPQSCDPGPVPDRRQRAVQPPST